MALVTYIWYQVHFSQSLNMSIAPKLGKNDTFVSCSKRQLNKIIQGETFLEHSNRYLKSYRFVILPEPNAAKHCRNLNCKLVYKLPRRAVISAQLCLLQLYLSNCVSYPIDGDYIYMYILVYKIMTCVIYER